MKYAYSYRDIRGGALRSVATGTKRSSLVEKAGLALSDAVGEAMARLHAEEVLFVCGGGDNGANGFVAARLLREQGKRVAVLCIARELSFECKAQMEKYGGKVGKRPPRHRYPVVVDCVLGTGILHMKEPLEEADALIDYINSADYVISCDVPSGLTAGGIAGEHCVTADETVCMGGLHQAVLLADGPDRAGKVTVVSLGIFAFSNVLVWDDGDVARYFPRKKSHSNKGNYGRVAVIAGYGSLGAPLTAVSAALKSGAGYTELLLPPTENADLDEFRRTLFSAKYPACIVDFYRGELSATAVAYGMGAGVGELQYDTVTALLQNEKLRAAVLDADALNSLAAYGLAPLKDHKCPVVITPHIKEFSRLTGKSVEEILKDPVECVGDFADEYGITVVLKNNSTVIGNDETLVINTTGSPALAKGGSGDALAGFLAGTCARGVPPFMAACASCYLLGRAGELTAKEMGEYAPVAEDVIARLPRVMPR